MKEGRIHMTESRVTTERKQAGINSGEKEHSREVK